MIIGTLKELNVKPGDVVAWHKAAPGYEYQNKKFAVVDDWVVTKCGSVCSKSIDGGFGSNCEHIFRIVSRASDDTRKPRASVSPDYSFESDTPKFWRDMTDAEKVALLLAHHEGKVIEFLNEYDTPEWTLAEPLWASFCAYRVKPEPVRKTFTHEHWVSMHSESSRGAFSLLYGPCSRHDTKGQTTIETVDGEPVKIVWEADDLS